MARYTAQILKAVTSTTVGIGTLSVNGTTKRLKLYEFIFGSDAATLGTSNWRLELQRNTTAGTGTNSSPLPIDPGDLASNAVGNPLTSLTANGTLTSGAIVMTIPLNEQATFRWIAAPGCELVIPATPNNGFHFMTPVCGNTPSAACQIYWDE